MNSKRHSKREFITIDDEDPNEQPAVKNKKAPVSSPEIIELQRMVAELEQENAKYKKSYHGACLIAGEAQARVLILEKREAELEKKLAALSAQLEGTRREKEYGNGLAPQPQMQQPQPALLQQSLRTIGTIPPADFLQKHANPTNILQLCHPKARDAFSLDSALDKLYALMLDHGRNNMSYYIWKRMNEENYMDRECEACRMTLSNHQEMFGHFLSKGHIANVRSQGGAVSLAAYQHWFRPLSLAPTNTTEQLAMKLAEITRQLGAATSKNVELSHKNSALIHEMAEMRRLAPHPPQSYSVTSYYKDGVKLK